MTDGFSLVDFIRPPEDATPRQVNRWRWNVMMTLLALIGFAAWAASPWGFAYAADIDRKISKAIEPIQGQLTAQGNQLTLMSQQLDQTAEDTKEVLIELLATKIRSAVVSRCAAVGSLERERLTQQIESLERQYMKRAGERYPLPRCDEL